MLKKLNIVKNISMSQNHSKVNDGWSEWQDNNSPIHNEAICPLFYTKNESQNSKIIDSDGNLYEISNNSLLKNGEYVSHIDGKRFVKEELKDLDGDLVELYDGHLYYGKRTDDTIEIFKDGEHYKTVYAERNPIVERLRYGDYFGAYIYNSTSIKVYAWDYTYIHNYNTSLKDIIKKPKMFVYNDLLTIIMNSGIGVFYDTIKPATFYKSTEHNSILHVNLIAPDGTVDVPSISGTYTSEATLSVTRTSTSGTRTCYYITDDGYYDSETHEKLTFEAGYMPIYTGSETYYRYTIFTTTYTYTGTLTVGGTLTSKMKVNVPNETSWTWDFDENTTTNTRILNFTNNFGAKNLSLPDAECECESTVWDIPQSAIQRNQTVYKDIPYETTAQAGQRIYDNSRGFIVLDDGYVYSLYDKRSFSAPPSYFCGWPIAGPLIHISESYEEATHSYVANGQYNPIKIALFGGQWPYMDKYCYDIGHNYFRIAASITTSAPGNDESEPDFQDKSKCWNFCYDSFIGYPIMDCGLKMLDTTTERFFVPYGSKENKINAFTPLLTNGFISGISYNGIMVTPWSNVDEYAVFTYDDENLYYKDNGTGYWTHISIVDDNQNELRYILDRYVVINTTSIYNCYDTKANKILKFANDYNGRLWYGSIKYDDAHNADDNHNLIAGSAINGAYNVNRNTEGVTSAYWPPVTVLNAKSTGTYGGPIATTNDLSNVDYFLITDANNAAPLYVATINNVVSPKEFTTYVKQNYIDNNGNGVAEGLYSSTTMSRNPTIFSEFISATNNQYYYVDGNWGYKMVVDSTTKMPILLSSGASNEVYNLSAIFVIQSMPYCIRDGKIYSLSYVSGNSVSEECIIDTKSMIFIGSTPIRAYFYSPNNRGIYAFTGDANLSKLRDASAISEIYKSWYNPATQTIFFSTNDGLYMLNEETSYKQLFYDVKDVIFLKDGSTAIIDGTTLYRLYYEDGEGRTTNQVRLNTGLYGAGDNNVFTIKKWYFSLFSDQRRNGKFKIKSFILRDDGKVEEQLWSKEIKSTDWDKDFNSLQISYTPANNRGVGVGVEILSDFAISDITVDADIQNTANKSSAKFKL